MPSKAAGRGGEPESKADRTEAGSDWPDTPGWNAGPGDRRQTRKGSPMDPETGKWIVIAIATVGAMAWLSGLAFMMRVTRETPGQRRAGRGTVRHRGRRRRRGRSSARPRSTVDPEELSEKLARLLARDGMGPLGPVKIVVVRSPARWSSRRRGCPPARPGTSRPASAAAGSGSPDRARGPASSTPSRRRADAILLGFGWLFVVLRPGGAGRCRHGRCSATSCPTRIPKSAARRSRWCRWSTSSGRRSCSVPCPVSPPGSSARRVEALVHNLPYS